jgi:hypothetical protein
MFKKQELAYIVLPDKRIIKRRIYSKYISNNSPSWVIVGGVKFYIDYYDLNNPTHKALGNLYKLNHCWQSDFGFANYAYVIDRKDRAGHTSINDTILYVDTMDNIKKQGKYNSYVNPCFFDNVKR